jgi:RNA polymerase sigma-70 factor, ECF subfamily
VGAERVARFLVNTSRKGYDPASASFASATINGAPGIVVSVGGEIDFVATFDATDDGRIAAIWLVRNPEKLGHLAEDVRLT